MSAYQLILAAAAGAVSLAICAVLWALAQRRAAEHRVAQVVARLAGLPALEPLGLRYGATSVGDEQASTSAQQSGNSERR